MLQWSFRLIHILHLFRLWKTEIIYNKKVSKNWFRAPWGKKLCQCSLSNCSSNSDLSLCLLDQYILWFPGYSWEHCVNGPFRSCICLGLKGPLYTTVISFTLRKFKLGTLFLHLLWNEFCGSYLWIIYGKLDKNVAHYQNPDTCPNNRDMF